MKETHMRANAPAEAREISNTGGVAVLESEIADLKEQNARLERRLAEAEMSAELRVRADRILAIPLPKDA